MTLGSTDGVRSILTRTLALVSPLLMVSWSCASSDSMGPPTVGGELGVGTFSFTCSPTAVVCPKATRGQGYTSVSLAQGSHVRIRFDREKGSATGDTIREVSPTMLASFTDGTGVLGFKALSAGETAIVAMTPTNELVDFAMIGIAAAARLDFTGPDGPYERNVRKLSLKKGSTTQMSAMLFDAYDVALAGDATFSFKTDASDVAAPHMIDERTAEIEAVDIGTAKLTVGGVGLEHVVTLEVTP